LYANLIDLTLASSKCEKLDIFFFSSSSGTHNASQFLIYFKSLQVNASLAFAVIIAPTINIVRLLLSLLLLLLLLLLYSPKI